MPLHTSLATLELANKLPDIFYVYIQDYWGEGRGWVNGAFPEPTELTRVKGTDTYEFDYFDYRVTVSLEQLAQGSEKEFVGSDGVSLPEMYFMVFTSEPLTFNDSDSVTPKALESLARERRILIEITTRQQPVLRVVVG